MKKIEKKLSLNKINLTALDANQLDTIKGGEADFTRLSLFRDCFSFRSWCPTNCVPKTRTQVIEE